MDLPWNLEWWQAWLGAAAVLGLAELVSLDLVLVMFAVGALVGMVVDLAGGAVWLQVVAALVTATAALTVVRPGVVKRLHGNGPAIVQGSKALVGRQAVVVREVSGQAGMVRIDGELWSARAYDETETIEVGRRVDVFEITGATARVHAVPELP